MSFLFEATLVTKLVCGRQGAEGLAGGWHLECEALVIESGHAVG